MQQRLRRLPVPRKSPPKQNTRQVVKINPVTNASMAKAAGAIVNITLAGAALP
jgi:hypothetical protein